MLRFHLIRRTLLLQARGISLLNKLVLTCRMRLTGVVNENLWKTITVVTVSISINYESAVAC